MRNLIKDSVFGSNKELALGSVPLILEIDTRLGKNTSMSIPVQSGINDFDVDWGDGNLTYNHTTTATHNYSLGGIYTIKITRTFLGFKFSRTTSDAKKVTKIIQFGNLPYSSIQVGSFTRCVNMTSLPNDSNFNYLKDGSDMFNNCSGLTSLPSEMTLSNLTTGVNMFSYCSKLTSLPIGMTLSNLSQGFGMFYGCTGLTHLPSGMTLPNLIYAASMFSDCYELSSLPSGMTLSRLKFSSEMFYSCSKLTSVPSEMTLSSLDSGTDMFNGCSLSKSSYSDLLIRINANNIQKGGNFGAGDSKYNAAGKIARDALTSRIPKWYITDGGYQE